MIDDLTRTLVAILSDSQSLAILGDALSDLSPPPTLPLSTAEFIYDRPKNDFAPAKPTVGLFLYDVRENTELQNNQPTVTRYNGTALITPAPLRVACTYLMTAWSPGGTELALLQEHLLLGQVLQVLSQYQTVPTYLLQGKLMAQDPVLLPITVGYPEDLEQPAEFWGAIGSHMRPSLSVTITISMAMAVSPPLKPVPLVTTELVRLGTRVPDADALVASTRMESYRIGGKVTHNGVPVSGATVAVKDAGLSVLTDDDGAYVLAPMAARTYTLNVDWNDGIIPLTISKPITVPAPAGQNYDVQL